jgi:hypothetical protein
MNVKVLATAIAAVFVALFVVACDDDGEPSTGLPDDFPVYEDSTRSELRQTDDGVIGIWETQDSPEEVVQFFETELGAGEWRVVGEPAGDDIVVIRVEREDPADDEPDSGEIVVIDDGESTKIVKQIGRRDTTRTPRPEATEPPIAGETPATGTLPPGYPESRVPLLPDATVTSASAPENSGAEIYLLAFTTGESPDEVVAYYEQALPDAGWTQSLKHTSNGNFLLTYADGNDSVTVSGSGDESGSTATITVVIQD